MNQRPNTRQTRSQTRAAQQQQQAGVNLQSDDAVDESECFEASAIDIAGGDDIDCGNCVRPNNAEMYMVQCERCQLYYHFSCAGVTKATVYLKPYVCQTCAQLASQRKTPSAGSAASTNMRSSQISAELRRIDEELQIEDQISQLLERKKQLLTKRHDLLNQQEDAKSRSSSRSSRTTTDRVQDWLMNQGMAEKPGHGVNKTMPDPTESINQLCSNPVDQLNAGLTSTPLTEKNLGAVPKGCKQSSKGAVGGFSLPIPEKLSGLPPLDVQSGLGANKPFLAKPFPKGTIGKLVVPLSAYDTWRSLTKRTALDKLPLNAEVQQREKELTEKLKRLEEQRKQEHSLQRDRERQLNRKLEEAEHEKQELLKQKNLAAAENENQRKLFEEFQRELIEQFEEVKIQQHQRETDPDPSENWYDHELLKLQRSREENVLKLPQKLSVCSSMPSISGRNAKVPVSVDSNISSPYGGRSGFSVPRLPSGSASFSAPRPNPVSQSVPHANMDRSLPAPVITPQQLAARQVVSKELPDFYGESAEWPLFISRYNHSTQTCGYTDSENLLRLDRAIKGQAREMVSSLLLHPSTVPELLSSLQLLYGRPEQIVHNLIAKVRATPAPKANRLDSLVTFGLVVQNLCGHLRAIGMEKHLKNPTLLFELVEKLPDNVKFNWELYQHQLPEVYMSQIATATSGVTLMSTAPRAVRDDRPKSKEKAFVNTHAEQGSETSDGENRDPPKERLVVSKNESNRVCPACGAEGHFTKDCTQFLSLGVDDRWKVVREKKLCRRCLTPHSRWPCKTEACGVNGCQKRHHRLLHYDPPTVEPKPAEHTNETVTIHRQPTTTTLFRMLPVTLYGANGQVDTFAFLDNGSSVTLVEKSIINQLGIVGEDSSLCIHWTSGIKKNISNTKLVDLSISGANNMKRLMAKAVYTVDELGLPEQSVDFGKMAAKYDHLRNLPIQNLNSAVPRILIGLNNLHLMSPLKLREGREDEPIATKTRLGWTVYGSMPGKEAPFLHRQMHMNGNSPEQDLHEYVRSFFAVESIGVEVTTSTCSPDEQRANQILAVTTRQTRSGRYETGLLWKQDYIEFPDNRAMAEKRMKCLEKRLLRDPTLYDNVRKQIADFQQKKFAHKATVEELKSFDPRRTWYLPLGVVINPNKPGKVRVIWDAAAKVEGVSLNSMLLKGPDLLSPLLSVLFKFRERQVAIGGDIEAMFHQVQIREEDRSAQLFYWRDSPEKP